MQQQHVPTIFLTRPMITSCDPDVLSVIVRQFDGPDGMASYDGVVSLLKTCHHFHQMKDMSWIKDLPSSWYYREFRAAMNLRSWPASRGRHFPHIAFYWQPPSPRTMQQANLLKMFANCPNELCARYGGDPDRNIPPGACYSILENAASLAHCSVSTSYCKKCYRQEIARCKVGLGAHNGRGHRASTVVVAPPNNAA